MIDYNRDLLNMHNQIMTRNTSVSKFQDLKYTEPTLISVMHASNAMDPSIEQIQIIKNINEMS